MGWVLKVLLCQDEIPYSTEVVISEFRDVSENLTVLEGTIIVNKESHRAIVIGKDGLKIKEVGTLSRLKLEEVCWYDVS